MLFLYNVVLIAGAFLWIPWMIIRARARKEQPNWMERAGDYELPPGRNPQRIWLHAVSVGEVMASLPIIKAFKEEMPGWEVVVSVTTSSGHQTAREKGKDLIDHIVYFPIDLPRFTLRAISRVRPAAIAIMETELWLNFLWTARQLEVPTLLINGRISDRNLSRSRFIKGYYRELFGHLTRLLVQTDTDRNRFSQLGASHPEIFGNCKYDQALQEAEASPRDWRGELGLSERDFVVVVGSTRGEEEEDLVIGALADALSGKGNAVILYAPRHIERAGEVARKLEKSFGSAVLRSSGEKSRRVVWDTYGELASLYSCANLVIIGGGFAKLGGQNLLQPLAHGAPVLHGPHMSNFREAATQAQEAGASLICATREELARAIDELMDKPESLSEMGARGRRMVEASRGASRRYAQAIAEAARTRHAIRGEELRARDEKMEQRKKAKKG